jgi:hypothetical protein
VEAQRYYRKMEADEDRKRAGQKIEVCGYSSLDQLNTLRKAEDKPVLGLGDEGEVEKERKSERWHTFKTP